MIENDVQLAVTKQQIKLFVDAISNMLITEILSDSPDRAIFQRATLDGMKSQLDDLEEEVAEYESKKLSGDAGGGHSGEVSALASADDGIHDRMG